MLSLGDAVNSLVRAVARAPLLGPVLSSAPLAALAATALVLIARWREGGAGMFRVGVYSYLGFLGLFAANFYVTRSRLADRFEAERSAAVAAPLAGLQRMPAPETRNAFQAGPQPAEQAAPAPVTAAYEGAYAGETVPHHREHREHHSDRRR